MNQIKNRDLPISQVKCYRYRHGIHRHYYDEVTQLLVPIQVEFTFCGVLIRVQYVEQKLEEH